VTFSLHSRRFWLLTLAALLVAGSTYALGQWQLQRAAQKEAIQAAINAKNSLDALDTKALIAIKNIASEIYRPAVLRGVWQSAYTVYLDNRPMNGRSGFWIVTPLLLQGTSQVILVQRGWAPRNFSDRMRLPEVFTSTESVTIEGRIAPPPSKLYEFEGTDSGRIRQNIDLNAFGKETGLALLKEASLLQIGAASEGLLRDWPAPSLGVDKHYGYAFQWFGLCALVIFLYVWFQFVVPFRASTRGPVGD